ncbi:hypothetical protein BSKO_13154 [Bryopsis sp. KO-2023]|nr:hypothetical protein BSKO_13154 [Bryopsis sp. KO-2023]
MDSHTSATRVSELRSVKELLWTHICERLPNCEQHEVKSVLGTLLINGNQALFDEASALSDMLDMVRESFPTTPPLGSLQQEANRTLVEQEIGMLVDKLKDCVGPQDLKTLLPQASSKDEAVVDYIVKSNSEVSSRGSNRTSSHGHLPRTPSSGRPSTSQSLVDPRTTVEPVESQLNAFDIDGIQSELRAALELEKETLLEDISYLQAALEEESDLACRPAPPPMQDLREYGSKLREVWLREDARREQEQKVSRLLSSAATNRSRGGMVGKLRSVVETSRDKRKDKDATSTVGGTTKADRKKPVKPGGKGRSVVRRLRE